jgi:hypothetical protein
MDFVRDCHVFTGTRCNCPEGTCRRDDAIKEDMLMETLKKQKAIQRRDDLVKFQIFLYDKGLINNTDWSYTEMADLFTKKQK